MRRGVAQWVVQRLVVAWDGEAQTAGGPGRGGVSGRGRGLFAYERVSDPRWVVVVGKGGLPRTKVRLMPRHPDLRYSYFLCVDAFGIVGGYRRKETSGTSLPLFVLMLLLVGVLIRGGCRALV